MTCREKLAIEHPDQVSEKYSGGCEGCPSHYGYLNDPNVCGTRCMTDDDCTRCWNREIPEENITNTDFEHPCTNCNTGWGSISTKGSTSCHDTCERLAAYPVPRRSKILYDYQNL